MKDLGKTIEREFDRFSLREQELILKNLGAIQLTEGCTLGCHGCSVDAKKGVTDYIDFSFLKGLENDIPDSNIFLRNGLYTEPYLILYFASEPFNYSISGTPYTEAHNLFNKKFNVGVTTAVPKENFKEIANFIVNDLTEHLVLSYRPQHKKRIDEFFSEYPRARDRVREGFHHRQVLPENWENLDENPKQCYHHSVVLASPTGFYNVMPTEPTKKHKNGIIIEKIKPGNDFEIVKSSIDSFNNLTTYITDANEDITKKIFYCKN